MKKILKGFTLVELIIVMAILVVLMAGIMNMFKPIRETYIDATLYESQRTVQNGVIQYVTESVRFSTDIAVYSSSGSMPTTKVTNAVEQFAAAYVTFNGVDSTKEAAVKDYIRKNAEVIIIDNSTNYPFNGENFTGRILRRKVDGATVITEDAEVAGSDECRMALGAAYYGESDLDITIGVTLSESSGTFTGIASDGIRINVASATNYANRDNFMSQNGTKLIKTSGLISLRNESEIGGTYEVATAVVNDKNNLSPSTSASAKVYIVYLNEKVDV